MKSVVRPMTGQDAAMVATLHATSWRSAYRGMLQDEFLDGDLPADRFALWSKRLNPIPQDHFGYIAMSAGEATGFAFAFGKHDSTWGTQIDNLHVLPEYKGCGIGRQLLLALCEESEASQPECGMYLWVYEENKVARRFYDRLGGRPVERLQIQPPGGGKVSELRYIWARTSQLLAALRRDA